MHPARLVPKLAVVAVVLAALLASVILLDRGRESPPDGAASPSPSPARAGSAAKSPAATPAAGARGVLEAWDRARARAWAAGDVEALAALYAPGSRVGTADAHRLQRWVDRGLVVEGLQTQVLSFDVLTEEPRRLVLDVTDRMVGGTAVGPDREEALPADAPSARRITLVRRHGRWLVSDVVDDEG